MESRNANSEESVNIAADKEAESEEVVENCTPCNLDEATVQAEHYCADCDEYYCGTCVKLHKKYCKNCPGINILGISEMRQWGQKKKETHRFQHLCENHPEKKLEMFCERHDIVCCHVCVSLHHRSCSQIAYIPHIAMKLGQSDATEKLLKDVKHITKDAVKSKSAREKDKVTLDKSKSNYEKTVLELNAKYLAILKSLKEKTTETMTDLYDKYRKEIEDEIEDINKMTKDMNDIQECLTNKDDVTSNFINIKESQRKVNKSYKTLSHKLNNRKVQYKFTVDEKVQTFLNAVSDLQPNPEKHLSGLEHLGKPVTDSPDKVFKVCTGGDHITSNQRNIDPYLLQRKDSFIQMVKVKTTEQNKVHTFQLSITYEKQYDPSFHESIPQSPIPLFFHKRIPQSLTPPSVLESISIPQPPSPPSFHKRIPQSLTPPSVLESISIPQPPSPRSFHKRIPQSLTPPSFLESISIPQPPSPPSFHKRIPQSLTPPSFPEFISIPQPSSPLFFHESIPQFINKKYLGSIDIPDDISTFNSACFISDDDRAVTFSNKTIFISPFDVPSESTNLIKEMQFDHDCFGIAHHDGILYVSSREGSVYMYDLSQTCIKKIETDHYGHRCFYKPHHMTISPDKTKLYVTDWFKGLVTLDLSGNVLSTFSHPDLAGACDVTTDIEGHVFVCGYNSKNVVQINRNGTEKIQTTISGLNSSPISLLCVSKESCKYLMVSSCNRVDAYTLTEQKILKVQT